MAARGVLSSAAVDVNIHMSNVALKMEPPLLINGSKQASIGECLQQRTVPVSNRQLSLMLSSHLLLQVQVCLTYIGFARWCRCRDAVVK